MKVTLESTSKIVQLVTEGGAVAPARIWEGHTDTGIEVHAFITRVAVHHLEDATQFTRELEEQRPPSPELAAVYPSRLVL